MALLAWPITVLIAFLTGVFYTQFLTVHPLRMSRHLLVTCLLLFAWLSTLVLTYESIGQAMLLTALTLAAALAGYAWMARRVLGREDDRPVPELTRKPDDPGVGHTAVIYFTHGEPETYDPIGWFNQFREFDEQGIAFIPFLIRPFFIHKLRQKYLQVGSSGHRKMHHQMKRRLEETFRSQGDQDTRFYLCFLDDEPRPDAAVIQALNEGASQIVVLELFLTISNHTAEGKELIEALEVEDLGVPIRYTGPMYDSETLKSMFVSRANAHLGETPKAEVGILLVGHGQPDAWDEEWGTETSQEISFREDILNKLADDGFLPQNMDLAWMMFKEPKPARMVETYVNRGLKKILYFPAAISAEAIHSQADIPELIDQARIPEDFPVLNMGAWNDDPLVIQAMVEKIQAQIDLSIQTPSHQRQAA